MSRDGWTRFRSSRATNCVQFDLMGNPPRFLRIRDRSRDDREEGNAYIVIDLWANRVLDDQTTYRPRQSPVGNLKG